jgi:D-serine deaminase-like pyridoxal phosphate-dependent protein
LIRRNALGIVTLSLEARPSLSSSARNSESGLDLSKSVSSARSVKAGFGSASLDQAHERARTAYRYAIGRKRNDLITPALIVDLDIVRKNLAFMTEHMKGKAAKLRPHIKVHKSPDIARLQMEAGAIGIGTATLWEAVVIAQAGIKDVFVINEVVGPEKTRAAALLARHVPLKIAVDDPSNVKVLSEAAQKVGSEIGCIVEVDTGMHRCGVASPDEALKLARMIDGERGLRLEGITGYEGHCSLEFDKTKREHMARQAMDYFVGIAKSLTDNGLPCPIVSAAGTGTWEITASHPGITEIQPGSYATMDGYHAGLEPRFKQATTVLGTVISRRADRIVTDAGKKTVGATEARLRDYDFSVYRYDEEHGIFNIDGSCPLNVGDTVELLCGYTPFAVSYFDVYHVVENGRVVDIWPVMPRGPEHGGLLNVFDEH